MINLLISRLFSPPCGLEGLNQYCSVNLTALHHNHSESFIYQEQPSFVSCAGFPLGTHGSAEVDSLTVPSHRRPLSPCAATPALNGGSPSGEEAERLWAFTESERGGSAAPTAPSLLRTLSSKRRLKVCGDIRLWDFEDLDNGLGITEKKSRAATARS